jgi:hypothetical protein
MKADIYYPMTDQNVYGQIKKNWVYDRTVAINATPIGVDQESEARPKPFVKFENILLARTRGDVRIKTENDYEPITNVLIANIRTADDSIIYLETAGERSGRGTLYEIASLEPFMNPFRTIEYYKIVLRRTENQGVDN